MIGTVTLLIIKEKTTFNRTMYNTLTLLLHENASEKHSSALD